MPQLKEWLCLRKRPGEIWKQLRQRNLVGPCHQGTSGKSETGKEQGKEFFRWYSSFVQVLTPGPRYEGHSQCLWLDCFCGCEAAQLWNLYSALCTLTWTRRYPYIGVSGFVNPTKHEQDHYQNFWITFEGSFIKYWLGWWFIPRIPREWLQTTFVGSLKGKANKTIYFLSLSNLGKEYIPAYFLPIHLLPTFDQAHPVLLGQPTLFIQMKTCGLLSYTYNSLQQFRKLSVLGQVGLISLRPICFIDLLSTVIKT